MSEALTILAGDCVARLRDIAPRSVQCCVTSPPYFGLRDYGVEGQIGAEETPAEFVDKMVEVFRGVREALSDDGVLWLNLGDSYAGSGRGVGGPVGDHSTLQGSHTNHEQAKATGMRAQSRIGSKHGEPGHTCYTPPPKGSCLPAGLHEIARQSGAVGRAWVKPPGGFKCKDMLGMPWRVAFALQADGWYLRAACPWIKRNGMPDSTTSRPTQCVETVFMLTKSKACFYDAEAVKKAAKAVSVERLSQDIEAQAGSSRANAGGKTNGNMKAVGGELRLRRSSDWFFESWQGLILDADEDPAAFLVNTRPFTGAHFATFPPTLVEPCVIAGTSEKGCCPACGLQWVREVERTAMVIRRSERTHEFGRSRSSGTMISPPTSVTTGWRAACQCGKDPIPCAVLDPFGGSGTTGAVALSYGRRAVLIELNPEYISLIRARCEQGFERSSRKEAPQADDPAQLQMFAEGDA